MLKRPWKVFRERMLGGFAWNVLAAGSTQGSLFLTHLIVARLLGVSEFGRYALLLTTAMAISSIAQSGVGFVAAKYVAEFHLVDKERAGRILSLCRFASLCVGVPSGLVLILGAEVLATAAFGHPDMAYGLKIIGLSVPFLALNVYQQGALQGFGEFRRSGLVGAAAGVLHVSACRGRRLLLGSAGSSRRPRVLVGRCVSARSRSPLPPYRHGIASEVRLAASARTCTSSGEPDCLQP